jgi:hypothetical protein
MTRIPHWHHYNHRKDSVVYVPPAELACCVETGDGLIGTPDGTRVYDASFILEGWRRLGPALDAYIVPQPSGNHNIGVRYGKNEYEYLSPAAHKGRTSELLAKYWDPAWKCPPYTAYGRADWSLIPKHMVGGLRRWIEQGIVPGSFLSAVLRNDLRAACECADDVNRHRLFDYVKFLYCYPPAESWGSPENFESWRRKGGLQWPNVYGG